MSLDLHSYRYWLSALLEDIFRRELTALWEELLMQLDFIQAVNDEFRSSGQVDKLVKCALEVVDLPMAFDPQVRELGARKLDVTLALQSIVPVDCV